MPVLKSSEAFRVYAVPTWNCNLHCPHCFVRDNAEARWDEKAFIKTLLEMPDDWDVILHGGEPTLYIDRLVKVLETGRIRSITSNLVISQDRLDILNKSGLPLATSWNPGRFNEATYEIWLNNLKALERPCWVLITLTDDLLDIAPDRMIEILRPICGTGRVEAIGFEPCLYPNEPERARAIHKRADDWLIDVDRLWEFKHTNNNIRDQILNWHFNCRDKTLQPNGTMSNGCLMALDSEGEKLVLPQCLGCKLAGICRPCKLQNCCSFFPRFYDYVKNGV